MANQARKASTFPPNANLAGNDSLLAITTSLGTLGNNVLVTVTNLLGNSQCNVVATNGNFLIVQTNTTPANSTQLSNILQGSMWFDGSYLYFADAPNHVKRMGPFSNF